MESGAFEVEAAVEASHWWFVGRRRLFSKEILELGFPQVARILDVGTSTGTNLRMLRSIGFANVEGLDLSAEAIRFCAEKGLGSVARGDVLDIPFEDGRFDLVLATDIIEHVDDDRRAVEEIMRVLRPGGSALVTVPAFESLWGLQDRVAQHKRRYRRLGLIARLRGAGFVVQRCYYFNYLLFIPILVARRLIDLLRIEANSEAEFNSPIVNRALDLVFAFDIRTARAINPPFGVSLLAVVEKPASGA